jgi:hypothetical protein
MSKVDIDSKLMRIKSITQKTNNKILSVYKTLNIFGLKIKLKKIGTIRIFENGASRIIHLDKVDGTELLLKITTGTKMKFSSHIFDSKYDSIHDFMKYWENSSFCMLVTELEKELNEQLCS